MEIKSRISPCFCVKEQACFKPISFGQCNDSSILKHIECLPCVADSEGLSSQISFFDNL